MAVTAHGEPVVLTGDVAPVGLLDAFWDHVRALRSNDVVALDAVVLDRAGPEDAEAVCGYGCVTIVDDEQIAALRSGGSAASARRVVSVAVQRVCAHAALVVAGIASPTCGQETQTQLWRHVDGSWRMAAAHASGAVAGIGRTMWRVVGAPLRPGAGDGALSGDTLAVKDLFAIEGQIVGAGVTAWARDAPIEQSTASAIQRLLDAGAALTGLAQTDQFAYGIAGINDDYGTPLNAQAPDRVPGGSTSGPASAVAQGLVTVGLGTDTAGSIRVPAS